MDDLFQPASLDVATTYEALRRMASEAEREAEETGQAPAVARRLGQLAGIAEQGARVLFDLTNFANSHLHLESADEVLTRWLPDRVRDD